MGSMSAESDYLSDVLSNGVGDEWAVANGYIHKDDIKTELEALKQMVMEDWEAWIMAFPVRDKTEEKGYKGYLKALNDMAKHLDITLE